jgi:hypothetical protein
VANLELEIVFTRLDNRDTGGCEGCDVEEYKVTALNWWKGGEHSECKNCPWGKTEEWEVERYGRCTGLCPLGHGVLEIPVKNWDRSRMEKAPCGIGDKIGK